MGGENIFDINAEPSTELLQLLSYPKPDKRIVIYFTPRSGSSWLSGVIKESQFLGCGEEIFNPNLCTNLSKKLGIKNIDEYIPAAQQKFKRGTVFSLEVTAHQIRRVFCTSEDFFLEFKDEPAFWLIREDIILQAISLAKMVSTKVSHSVNTSPADREKADEEFVYDADLFKKWATHILEAEKLSENWFAEYGINPLRMSYEQIVALPPRKMLNILARHAGLPDVTATNINPLHSKVGTPRNEEFAVRFRAEERRWLRKVEAERSMWLGQLDDLASIVSDI